MMRGILVMIVVQLFLSESDGLNLTVYNEKSYLEQYYENFKEYYSEMQIQTEKFRQGMIGALSGQKQGVAQLEARQRELEEKWDDFHQFSSGEVTIQSHQQNSIKGKRQPEQHGSRRPTLAELEGENSWEGKWVKGVHLEPLESGSERRVLQPTNNVYRMSGECFAQARKVVIQDLYPFCNGEWVSIEEYNVLEAEDSSQCILYYRNREVCYCPADRYGSLCEQINFIQCEVLSPTKEDIEADCPAKTMDSFEYVGSLDGNPPCRYLDANSKLNLNLTIKCQNLYTEYTLEEKTYGNYSQYFNYRWDVKVRNSDGDLVDADQSPFTYFYNFRQQRFVTSYDSAYWVSFQGLYWEKLNFPYTIDFGLTGQGAFNLTLAQMKDSSPIQIDLDLGNLPSNLSQYGRYTFQISTKLYIKDPSVIYTTNTSTGPQKPVQKYYNSESIVLFYEDSSYSPGTISIPLTSGQIAGIVIGSVLFALMLIYSVRVYLHHKKQSESASDRLNFLDQIDPLNN